MLRTFMPHCLREVLTREAATFEETVYKVNSQCPDTTGSPLSIGGSADCHNSYLSTKSWKVQGILPYCMWKKSNASLNFFKRTRKYLLILAGCKLLQGKLFMKRIKCKDLSIDILLLLPLETGTLPQQLRLFQFWKTKTENISGIPFIPYQLSTLLP